MAKRLPEVIKTNKPIDIIISAWINLKFYYVNEKLDKSYTAVKSTLNSKNN